MKISIWLILILIITVAIVCHLSTTHKSKSLYERLGGIYNIATVVDHFSDALIMNPLVGQNSPNPQLANWSKNKLDRLPGLKWMRTLWLADVAGGPYKFIPTKPGKCPLSLENAHKSFKITPAEFDAVAGELKKSLEYFKVPPQEQAEVMFAFTSHKSEVDFGSTGIRPTINC